MTQAPRAAHDPSASRAPRHAPEASKNNEPPRRQAEVKTLSERFSAKVERAGDDAGRSSEQSAERAGQNSSARSRSGEFDSMSGENGHQSEGEFARADMARILAGKDPQAIAAQSALSPADKAVFERMAAQIAESWPSASQPSAEIEFPPGFLAQGAHLQRQADGGIAIRIAGLDPKLNALRAGYAQLALLHGLGRRRLSIASLQFERASKSADGAQPGRLSDMPKAV